MKTCILINSYTDATLINILIAKMITPQETQAARVASLLQTCRQAQTETEDLHCYEQIIAFISELYVSDRLASVAKQLLIQIHKEHLFHAVFAHLTHKLASNTHHALETSITSFVISMIDDANECNAMKRMCIIDTILVGKCVLLINLLQSCKQSQSRSQQTLTLINDALVKVMYKETVTNRNFTYSLAFALKIIQCYGSVNDDLVDEALRHVLIVDHIQKGQVFKIISQNQALVNQLCEYGKSSSLSSSWHYLISKLASRDSLSTSKLFPKITQIFQYGFARIVRLIEADADLNCQIDKIRQSQKPAHEKLRLIQLIRSYSHYLLVYLKNPVRYAKISQGQIRCVEQCLGIRDFLSFSYIIQLYVMLITSNLVQLTASAISMIQQNCLPAHNESVELPQSQYDINELHFLSKRFDDKVLFQTSQECSEAMGSVLKAILDQRGCGMKQKICVCWEEHIHLAIQSQYDHQFNTHQFMSACHLMRRQIERVIKLNPDAESLQKLKLYVLNNLKWLLNLSESCLPQHRRCIHFKLFDLLMAFPPLLYKNQFLKQVVDNQLISRLPYTALHLKRLIGFYQSELRNKEDKCENGNALQRLSQKLLTFHGKQLLNFEGKLNLWNLIMTIWQNDEIKLNEMVEKYATNQEDSLAQYCVAKQKRLPIAQKLTARSTLIREQMVKHSAFYQQPLRVVSLVLKNA